ncbi:DUF6527 family protein [Marinobacter salsuginis]|uniref:DUF6527 family protein n=1 Tax=Marinobacter salsuginis TaxID=418719 RepID=UPI001ADF9F41|nr:DUF6527 family protein [Marinobacter salsuginis]QTN40942.1 ammonia monooxygenase [Marinobacter salsuginis]
MADVIRVDGPRASFTCPGCKARHTIMIAPSRPGTPVWTWNGRKDQPTFKPSILVTGTWPITDDEADRIMAGEKIEPEPFRCHSFVTDGRIRFLSDCTHEMAGETVDLVPEARP